MPLPILELCPTTQSSEGFRRYCPTGMNANTFVVNALPRFDPLLHPTPRAVESADEVDPDDLYRLFLVDDAIEVADDRRVASSRSMAPLSSPSYCPTMPSNPTLVTVTVTSMASLRPRRSATRTVRV